MDFETFKEKDLELNRRKIEIDEEKKKLRGLYVEEHREFKNGEKVLVTRRNGKSEEGFIIKAYLDVFCSEIKYQIAKCKKDGKPSKMFIHSYNHHKIERVEK